MKKKILILVSILVVFLAIPPFVNYWVSTPSPIGFIPIEKQEVWISFYASLIGSGITLLGVALTIVIPILLGKKILESMNRN